MPHPHRLAMSCAAALLVLGGTAGAQSFSPRRPGLSAPPPSRQAPQAPACGPTALSESSSMTVTDLNSVSCNSGGFHTDNHYWRAFTLADFGIDSAFQVCEVTIGVEAASSVSGNQPISINLYTSDPAFPGGVLTPIGSSSTTVSDQSLSLATFPVSGTAPAGSQLVVEIFTPSGIADLNSFFIGSNAAAETAPSYISAADCGLPDPTTTSDAGAPNMHIVMTVDGTAIGPAALAADPPATVAISGNGVLEIGETAVIAPSWQNGGLTDFSLTGVATNFTGPFNPGTFYNIDDGIADYGVITAGTTGTCVDCYAMTISGERPTQHFDATFDETVTVSPLTLRSGVGDTILKTWTLHVGESFGDVSNDLAVDPFYPSIETIFHHGITAGCGDGTTFCPDQNVLRQEMAVFLLKAFLTSSYVPPACTPPGVFTDVACPGLYTDWIEDLKTRNITAGCGDGTIFCPESDVLRQEMAVFLLKTLLGSDYVPPACTPPGVFTDVACPGQYTDFIEDLKTRGITAGCGDGSTFCPTDTVTRQEMAAFLTRTFSLVLYGP